MTIQIKSINVEDILETVPSSTYHRGKKYFQENRVKILIHSSESIESEVQGSDPIPYQVKIDKNGQNLISAKCSCPIRKNCKHIIATIFEILKDSNSKISYNKKSTSPSAEKKIELSMEELYWIEKISSEDTPSSHTSSGIYYILNFYHYTPHSLTIQLCVTRRKKNGDLSQSNGKIFNEDAFSSSLPTMLKNACDQSDNEIVELLWKKASKFEIEETEIIQKIIATGRSCYQSIKNHPLNWGAEKNSFLSWEIHQSSPKISLQTENSLIFCFLLNNGGIYIDPENHQCGLLSLPQPPHLLKKLLTMPIINPQNMGEIQKQLSKVIPDLQIQEKKVVQIKSTNPISCLTLDLTEDEWHQKVLKGKLSFFYDQFEVLSTTSPKPFTLINENNQIYQVYRSQNYEFDAIRYLRSKHWYGYDNQFKKYVEEDDYIFLIEQMEELKKQGWIVQFTDSFPIKNILHPKDDWYIEVNEAKNHWFELEIGQKINGQRVNLIPYLQKYLSTLPNGIPQFESLSEMDLKKEIPILDENGNILMLSLEKLKAILEPFLGILNTTTNDSKLHLPHWQASALSNLSENLQETRLEWQSPEKYKILTEQLKHIKKIDLISPPQTLQAQLRPYQIEGVSWMQFLRKYDLAGILADEMGLGKTIQTLTHILIEKEAGRLTHPALVIAPTTLMGNWWSESQKFAPSLKIIILQGNDRKKHFNSLDQYDVILTTYPLLARDQEILLNTQYHLMFLDEAQNIKNAKTQAYSVIQKIQATHRLCLTGTPMENHLGELWSLFSILLPGFLGNEKEFQKLFRKPIEKDGALDRKKILQKRITPFLLRRVKSEVTKELPMKNEIINTIELSEKQQELYEAVRLTMMEKVMSEVQNKGLSRSRIVLLDALLKLRQICCDPRLLNIEKKCSEKDSAKLQYLREMLPQMIENNQKILIFSQFTSMLDIIEKTLEDISIPYVLITGQTKDRITPVQRFQSNEVPVFLISLKAGGCGLNLTAADTVIHYDPWWNPAVENQATDRAHRIGQTKNVFVYKWITKGTVEEKILQLQNKKKQLADSLFDDSNSDGLDLNLEDLQSLFAPISHTVR